MAKIFLAIVFVALVIIPQAGTALVQSSLSISLSPSSIAVGDTFSATVYYRDNESANICGASCAISGGSWLYSSMADTGCVYTGTFSGPDNTGSHTVSVSCARSGYYNGYSSASLYVAKKSSYISLATDKTSAYPGESIEVKVYYNDQHGRRMAGNCYAYVYSGQTSLSEAYMPQVSDYHVAYVKAPLAQGSYTIKAKCTSDQYADSEATATLSVTKKQSTLRVETGTIYYGQQADVRAYYSSQYGAFIANGKCEVTLVSGGAGTAVTMHSQGAYYSASVLVGMDATPKTLSVSCESSDYESKTSDTPVSPQTRPTQVAMKSSGTSFRAGDSVPVSVAYTDTLTGQYASGAKCYAEASGRRVDLLQSGGVYSGSFSSVQPGSYQATIKCEKAYYSGGTSSFSFGVRQLKITLETKSVRTEFKKGDEITFSVAVKDELDRAADTACDARMDFYEGAFGSSIYNTLNVKAVKNGTAYAIKSAGADRAAKVRATVSCGGGMYEKAYRVEEFKVVTMGESTKTTLVLAMSAATAILLAMFFLMKKKLKVIS